MGRASRGIAFVLGVVLVVGPAVALAAECAGCCCPPAPCHDSARGQGSDCVGEVEGPCCTQAPAVLPAGTKCVPELPAVTALAAPRSLTLARLPAAQPAPRSPDLVARTSPLRRSVVLLN